MRHLSIAFCILFTSGSLFGQEGKEKQNDQHTKAPPIGVLRLKDPTGDPLPLQFSAEAATAAMKKLYQIHQALFAYAQGNDQVFPVGKNANEAFRKLFIMGLMDDERLFHLEAEGDKENQPDGLIGSQNDGYKAALTAGECSFYYISGLTSDRDDSTLPIAYAKVTGKDDTIYVVVVRIGGGCKVYETKDGIVKEEKDGKMVDILSEAYGTDPGMIRAPLEPEKKK